MGGSQVSILLIDDDADMHHAARLMLEPAGYEIRCESTGPAGLNAIRRDPPDLILLDIMLAAPTEGIELAATLKDNARFKGIPIIMISSIGQQIGADLAQQTGVDSVKAERFLEKPLSAQTLLTTVRDVLDRCGASDG